MIELNPPSSSKGLEFHIGDQQNVDLTQLPHLLIAGATGSGKSVAINATVCSLIRTYGPEHLNFIMLDPKRLELAPYRKIPHIRRDICRSEHEWVDGLRSATLIQENRYRRLERGGYRNIREYNANEPDNLPYIVVVIDEFAHLASTRSGQCIDAICELARLGRAAGIHCVMATQRPSAKIVDGEIRANFPARVALKTATASDSRIIIDQNGAEELAGNGAMLFRRSAGQIEKLQGPYVSIDEVRETVTWAVESYNEYQPQTQDPHEEPETALYDESDAVNVSEQESSWTETAGKGLKYSLYAVGAAVAAVAALLVGVIFSVG